MAFKFKVTFFFDLEGINIRVYQHQKISHIKMYYTNQ